MAGIKKYLLQLLGFDEVNITPDEERRKAVITFSIIGAAFLLVFAVFELTMESLRIQVQARAQVWAALLLVLPTLSLAFWVKNPGVSENALVVTGFVVFLMLTYYGGIAEDAIFWTFVFPYLVFFLKGQRAGWIVGIAYALIAPLIMALGAQSWGLWYRQDLNIYYSISYLFNVLVAAAFNLLRGSFQARLWEAVEFNTREVRRHLQTQQYHATHDSATDLLNREGLLPEIERQILEGTRPVWVITINFHRALELSSIAGLPVLNVLMQGMAKYLQDMGWSESTVGRLRQDELCLVLSTSEGVGVIADRITGMLNQAPLPERGGFSLHGAYSVGLASQVPVEISGEGERLLRKAEQAQRHAQHGKLLYVLYDAEVERELVLSHMLYEKVRSAVWRNEFSLHYQPQIDLKTRKVVGAEALARWFDKTEGAISPGTFIPIIETSGLLPVFSIFTIKTAIQACAAWQSHLPGKTVSINLSADALLDTKVIDAVREALREHEIDPALVIIELTESVMLKSPELSIAAMDKPVALGVSLSIDDYGSGFSSLSYVKQLPARELKIDQSFVTKCFGNAQDKAIIASTIELGHQFGLHVLAEGVEDEETAMLLRAMGCDLVQGWYYAKALPEAEFTHWAVEFDKKS